MTAAKLDHVALSLAAIEDAKATCNSSGVTGFLALAQVHATLAVAEQTRVANLIAASASPDITAALAEAIAEGMEFRA